MNERVTPTDRRRSLLSGLAALGLLAAAGLGWFAFQSRLTTEELLAEARRQHEKGNSAAAEELAQRALERDPKLGDAAWLAGECAADRGAWEAAVEHFQRARNCDSGRELEAHLREAEILHEHLHRLGEAEQSYRAALRLEPENVSSNAGLARLLTLCGRSSEVTPHVLRLIRQDAEPDLLVLLVRPVATDDREALSRAREAAPSDPNPLVGLAWHALQSEQFDQAEAWLKTALDLEPHNLPALVLRGRLLLAMDRAEDFAAWNKRLPQPAAARADVWLLRGQMAERLNQVPGAIRCFWESLRRAPESRVATVRLVHNLSAHGDAETAAGFRQRIERLTDLEQAWNRTLFTADRGRLELLLPLARAYEQAGRIWEAYGWSRFALEIGMNTPELQSFLQDLKQRLKAEPLELVTRSANTALTVDLAHFPVPDLRVNAAPAAEPGTIAASPVAFRNDAESQGLAFRYFNGVRGATTRRMFELTGGGIGVLDYDLDDAPDLVLTQGCVWPPGTPDDSGGDRLFRNGPAGFEDVTERAGLLEDGFGQGVAVGDYNADGFPDLHVANIGRNRLWMNRGDGTLEDVTDAAGLQGEAWTTSTLVADLNGDGLPDIYDVTYLAGTDVFDRVCRHPDGSPKQCLPQDFEAAPDRVWKNLGNGSFRETTSGMLGLVPEGMGLGIAAWDAQGQGRLSVFVANDTTQCFLFQPADEGLVERGVEAGVAFNGAGKATGAMGVAIGDADGDARMDLFITNFAGEPNTLFLNTLPGFFEDQTRRAGLDRASFDMLGFGTQFLDADLDGTLELVVSNGHVDDLSRFGRPYRMPPQVFRSDGRGRFVEVSRQEAGDYFQRDRVGRAVARLDWNRDGREDLVVGHLHDPVALLTNVTADTGGHLSLHLVGVTSNREAIGTTVDVLIGSRTQVRQVTAGDGYQCSNERRVTFGTGTATRIDELTVRWPSGLVQQFQNVAVPARLRLCEGADLLMDR